MMSESDRNVYAIIQEGEEQVQKPSEAAYLFSDEGFSARRAFAELFTDRYWIATAEYSLTLPGSVVEPYETSISELEDNSPPEITPGSWSRKAWLILHGESAKWLNCDELVVLAGEPYVELLGDALDNARDVGFGDPPEVSTPFVDMNEPEERKDWIDERLTEQGAFA